MVLNLRKCQTHALTPDVMAMLCLLAGTGMRELISSFPNDINWSIESNESIRVSSPWGEVPADILTISGPEGSSHRIFMIQRHHGDGVVTPPHMIEHRANVHAASSFSPKVVVSINSVGSLRSDFPPGNIGLAVQTIDFTGRVWTFHDDDATHADMTSHFDAEISDVASNALLESQDSVPRLVVAQMTGPQFETSAEIEALSRLGADAVGMTLTAEAKLVAELGLKHVGLSVSSNWAAGRTPGDSAAEIDHHAVEGLASKVHARLWSGILSILDH